MAWGGDEDRRPETDEGEDELDETVSRLSAIFQAFRRF